MIRAANIRSRARRAFAAGLAALGALWLQGALAQAYPSRPVTIVVPAPPGGITDQLARLVSTRLAERLGQTVLVEYKPGAGASLAAEYVARAPADGYTLLVGTQGSQITNRYLYKQIRYDPEKDFAPVHGLIAIPNVVVVNSAKPWQTMKDFVEAARQQPGKLSSGSAGNGTSGHLTLELFQSVAGIKLVHTPYKGSSPAINDLLGGQIDMSFDYAATTLGHIQAGKLRALAVTSPQRLPSLPQVPTMAELGYPSAESVAWVGLFFPARTPQAVVDRWQAEVDRLLREPASVEALTRMGGAPLMAGGAAYGKFIQAEHGKWMDTIQRSGVKLD